MLKNKSKIFKQYKSAETSNKSANEVVGTLLNELDRSMNIIATGIENEIKGSRKPDVKLKSNHFTRAMVAIYSLQTSLDFDAGGPLALQLFQLYEYCRQQLIRGFSRKVVEGIKKASDALKEIISAWDEMVQNASR